MTKTKSPSSNIFHILVDFHAPLLSVALMMLGVGFFTTFVTLYLNDQGYSNTEIGYAQSAYFFGMFLGGFKMESFIRKIGHIQTLAVFGSLGTSTILLQGLLPFFPLLVFCRFLLGLSITAIYIVIESWMLDRSTVKIRGVVLSLYMIFLYAAQAASQQFLVFLSISSTLPFLIAAFFTSLCVIPVSLSTEKFILPAHLETMKFSKIFRISPFGTMGCLVSGIILSVIYSFFPLFAIDRAVRSEQLMFATIGGGMLLQWPIGKLSDYFERRLTLISIVFAGMLLSIVPLLYEGSSEMIVFGIAFLFGGVSFTLYPVSISQVCDHLDQTHITKAAAFLTILYGLGSIIGPNLVPGLIQSMGMNGIFLFFCIVLGELGGIGLFTYFSRPKIPKEEQNAYLPLSPMVQDMDPRFPSKK